jgi:hypothetical protein
MVRLVQTMHLSCTYIAPALTLSPNGPKQGSTWPKLPRTSIFCVQNILCVYSPFGAKSTPILRQNQHYLQMRWNELPLEPRHLGVPSGASKMIFKPMVRSAQTVHLYCIDTNTVSKWTKMRLHMTHSPRSSIGCIQDDFWASWYIQHKPHTYLASRLTLSTNGLKRASTWAPSPRSTIGCVQNDFDPMVCWAQTVHQSCVKISTMSKVQKEQNEPALKPRHLGAPSGASKSIYEPMVHVTQTRHLSCTNTNTISKRNETRFHMTHIS